MRSKFSRNTSLRNVKLVCRCARLKVNRFLDRFGRERWVMNDRSACCWKVVIVLLNRIILVTIPGVMKSILVNCKIYFSAGRLCDTWNARKRNLRRALEYLVDRLVSGSRQCTVRKARRMKTIAAWTDRFFFWEEGGTGQWSWRTANRPCSLPEEYRSTTLFFLEVIVKARRIPRD